MITPNMEMLYLKQVVLLVAHPHGMLIALTCLTLAVRDSVAVDTLPMAPMRVHSILVDMTVALALAQMDSVQLYSWVQGFSQSL